MLVWCTITSSMLHEKRSSNTIQPWHRRVAGMRRSQRCLQRVVSRSGNRPPPVQSHCYALDRIRMACQGADQRCPRRMEHRLERPEPRPRRTCGDFADELLNSRGILVRQQPAHHLRRKLPRIGRQHVGRKPQPAQQQFSLGPMVSGARSPQSSVDVRRLQLGQHPLRVP
jgi:hypothetical protein